MWIPSAPPEAAVEDSELGLRQRRASNCVNRPVRSIYYPSCSCLRSNVLSSVRNEGR